MRAGAAYYDTEEGGLHLLSSTAHVTGAASHVIAGPVLALDGAGSAAIVSGVTLDPAVMPGWVVVLPSAEAYLELEGGGAVGTSLDLSLSGSAGAVGFVALSLEELFWRTAFGFVWIDPSHVLWTASLVAQAPPTVLAIPADPALIGFAVTLQALAFSSGLPPLLTNPAGVVFHG